MKSASAIETRTSTTRCRQNHHPEMPHISEAVGYQGPDRPVRKPEVHLGALMSVLTNLYRSAGTLVTSCSTPLALGPRAQTSPSLLVRKRISLSYVTRTEPGTLQNSVRDLTSAALLVVSRRYFYRQKMGPVSHVSRRSWTQRYEDESNAANWRLMILYQATARM